MNLVRVNLVRVCDCGLLGLTDEFLATNGPDLYPWPSCVRAVVRHLASGICRCLMSTSVENHLIHLQSSCLWDTLMDAQRGRERQWLRHTLTARIHELVELLLSEKEPDSPTHDAG